MKHVSQDGSRGQVSPSSWPMFLPPALTWLPEHQPSHWGQHSCLPCCLGDVTEWNSHVRYIASAALRDCQPELCEC